MRAGPHFHRVWPADLQPWWLPVPLRGWRRWAVNAALVVLPGVVGSVWWPVEAPQPKVAASAAAPSSAQQLRRATEPGVASAPVDPLESFARWSSGLHGHGLCASEWLPLSSASGVSGASGTAGAAGAASTGGAAEVVWRLELNGDSRSVLAWVRSELLGSTDWALRAWQWTPVGSPTASDRSACRPLGVRVRLELQALRELQGHGLTHRGHSAAQEPMPLRDPFRPPHASPAWQPSATAVAAAPTAHPEPSPGRGRLSLGQAQWTFDARLHGRSDAQTHAGWTRGVWTHRPAGLTDRARQPAHGEEP